MKELEREGGGESERERERGWCQNGRNWGERGGGVKMRRIKRKREDVCAG